MNECQHSCSWQPVQSQYTISKAAEGDCMASTSGHSAHHHSRQSSRHQHKHMQAAHSQPAGVLQQHPNSRAWPAAAPGRPISHHQPCPKPAVHHSSSSTQIGCCSSLLPAPKQVLNSANCAAASRPPMLQTSGSTPSRSSSTQGTPRRGASRGPRSYALALAAPNYKPPQSPNSQRDPAGAQQHSSSSSSSRPSSRAQEQLRRLGTAGYAHKARMQHSSRGSTPRTQTTQHQHQHHQQQAAPAAQQACSSGADRASHTTVPPLVPALQVSAASKAAGGPSRPQQGSLSSSRRPGSAATLHSQNGGSWWQQQGEQQGHGSNRPQTVAAGAPLLLADCFRPPSAAGPASISGCTNQRVGSRPHTAAAVAAGWWDAASAGLLDCHSFQGSGEAQQREEVADLRRQEQQQLWSAAHEIDGRPATRNGMRSR